MSTVVDIASAALLLAGTFFFTAGTLGLIRFPDPRSQLHALTKADNLGLGLIFLGAVLQMASLRVALALGLAWLLALVAASISARMLGRGAVGDGTAPPADGMPDSPDAHAGSTP